MYVHCAHMYVHTHNTLIHTHTHTLIHTHTHTHTHTHAVDHYWKSRCIHQIKPSASLWSIPHEERMRWTECVCLAVFSACFHACVAHTYVYLLVCIFLCVGVCMNACVCGSSTGYPYWSWKHNLSHCGNTTSEQTKKQVICSNNVTTKHPTLICSHFHKK